jgi:hypothetical protein
MADSPINPRPFGSDEESNREFFAGRAQGLAGAEAFVATAMPSELEESLVELTAFMDDLERVRPWLAGWEGGRWEVLEDAVAALEGRRICWAP